jgi:methylmalonyl-CoA mutase
MEPVPNILAEFPPVSKAQWMERIQKELAGRDLAAYFRNGNDPFPHPDDLEGQLFWPMRGSPGWEIGEDIQVGDDPLASNRQAIAVLEQGASSLRFLFPENWNSVQLPVLLTGIHLPLVSLHFVTRGEASRPVELFRSLAEHCRSLGLEPAVVRGGVELMLPPAGGGPLFSYAAADFPLLKLLNVRCNRLSGNDEEAADSLAALVLAALDKMEACGLPFGEGNRQLQFSLSMGRDYFLEIARLRALRLVWAHVQQAFGVKVGQEMPALDVNFHKVLLNPEEPPSNLIAASLQAMAAVLGGADRLTVLPADGGQSDRPDFYRRLARNIQHILKLESHLDWVADPAAGSYYIEKLTEKIASEAWRRIQLAR